MSIAFVQKTPRGAIRFSWRHLQRVDFMKITSLVVLFALLITSAFASTNLHDELVKECVVEKNMCIKKHMRIESSRKAIHQSLKTAWCITCTCKWLTCI